MPADGKKGITVKVDATLHAEVRQYLEDHSMTMSEFVSLALADELQPKHQTKEDQNMGNMRTLAFQVPEDLFYRIKDYLRRNNMTQRQFVIGLIEDELERDLTERESAAENEESQVEQEDDYEEEEYEAPDEESVSEADSETPEEQQDDHMEECETPEEQWNGCMEESEALTEEAGVFGGDCPEDEPEEDDMGFAMSMGM